MPSRSITCRAPAFFQGVLQIGLRKLQGRGQPEQKRRQQRNGERKPDHATVKVYLRMARQIAGTERQYQINAPPRQQTAAAAAKQSERSAFRDQLPDEP